MQPRSLMILSGLVLVLGAFIALYERKLPSTDERVKLEKKVLEIEPGEVQAVEISWGAERVALERREEKDIKDSKDIKDEEEEGEGEKKESEWWLAVPFSARADTALVEGLLGALSELEKQRTLEGVEPAAVGLASPRARVRVTTSEGESLLLVGGEVPNARAMIVGVEGRSDAYQVAEGLLAQLTKPPGEWRDKRLFTASRAEVERIALEGAAGRVALVRRGEGFWLESPISDLADREAVDGLLNQITGLRAERFVDQASAEAGLTPSAGAIEVVLDDRSEPWRIELGATESSGEIFAKVESETVTIAQDLAKNLEKIPDAWRSRGWTSFQVYQVDTAEIEAPAGKLTLSRAGADWKRGAERIAYTAATDFLYAVAEAKAEEITPREQALAAGFVLDAPRLAITVTNKDAESEQLSLFNTVGERVAATTSGRDGVLLLGLKGVAEVEGKLAAVRAAEPLPPPTEAAKPDAGDAPDN